MVENRVPAPSLSRPSAQGRRQAACSRGVEALLHRVVDALLLWLERTRQRRSLASLSDHMLKDLGLSRCDVGRESGKRFWED